jgi:hypothetical protein
MPRHFARKHRSTRLCVFGSLAPLLSRLVGRGVLRAELALRCHVTAEHVGLSRLVLQRALQSSHLALQIGTHFARHGCLLLQIADLSL